VAAGSLWVFSASPGLAQQAPPAASPAAAVAGGQQPAQVGAPGAATPAVRPGGGRGGGGFRPPDPPESANYEGWESLFDGSTLNGWAGNPDVWKVQDGAIVVESTPERRISTTYLVWQGGELGNFELKFDVKMEGAINGGVQFRSYLVPNPPSRGGGAPGGPGGQAGRGGGPGGGGGRAPQTGVTIPGDLKYNTNGYQFDFDGYNQYTGNLYEQGSPRQAGEMSWRGGVVQMQPGKRAKYIGYVGDGSELSGYVKINDWNQYHLICEGNVFILMINGHVMTVTQDNDPAVYRAKGIIALEVEAIGKISHRNIYLRRTSL
jgi:hypothetical protein